MGGFLGSEVREAGIRFVWKGEGGGGWRFGGSEVPRY